MSNKTDLESVLAELRNMLVAKTLQSKAEAESQSYDKFVKLISLSCRAITDLIKLEKELTPDVNGNQDWSQLADMIRNDPQSLRLAEKLSRRIYGKQSDIS
jgi:hypothetical protein